MIISKRKRHLKRRRKLRDYFSALGPGVITGAADNDPAGIATYSVIGASTGFSLLWLMLFTIPMLTVIEEMSARVGVVTKKGLARVIKERFGTLSAYLCAFIVAFCNIATIAADIAGVAAGIELITGISWKWFLVPVGALLAYLLLAKSYHLVSRFLFLLTPFFLLYIVDGFLIRPNWIKVLSNTFIPNISLTSGYLIAAVALLGTTISPYLIFWQTTEEVEEKKTVKKLKEESFDVALGMAYSNIVFYFIILCAGAVLFTHNVEIKTAYEAALALKPLAGSLAFIFFSIGLVVSGILAVPVLAASTGYVVAEVFQWKEGLNKKLGEARGFYVVILLSLALGLIAAFINLNPIKLLYYSQVLDGILTPVLIYFLIKITDDSALMRKHTNTSVSRIIGWATLFLMTSLSCLMFYQIFKS
jgi:NRAMP (natural resistance-associated macrophage protein)-like metal ion transporter